MNTLNQMFKKAVVTTVCISALGLVACAAPGAGTGSQPMADMKSSMQGMGAAYKAAMESTNMAQFNTQAALFQYSLSNASKNSYNGTAAEQEMYRQGMMEMKVGMALLSAAIVSNDLTKSKAALSNFALVRNKYHAVLKK